MDTGSPGTGPTSLTTDIEKAAESVSDLAETNRAFLEGAGVTFVGLVIGAALSISNEVAAARILGIEDYGAYAIGMMLTKIGEILAMFGLSFGLLHYLPVYLRRSEFGLALGAIIGALLMPLGLGGSFAAALAFGGDWLALHVFNKPQAGPFIITLGFVIPIFSVSDVIGNAARGFGRSLPYIVIRGILPGIVYAGLLAVIAISGAPPITVARGWLIATAVGMLTGLAWINRLLRKHIGRSVSPVFQLRPLYGYSLPILMHFVISLSLAYTDIFLLGTLSSVEAVGIYRGCIQVIFAFDLVLNACSAAAAPLFPVQIAGQQNAQLAATYSGAIRLACVLSTPGLLLIVSNSYDILGLLGPAFVAGWMPLSILSVGYYCKTVVGVAGVLLVVGGKPRLEVWNGVVTATLNICLNLLLIPRFGLIGAAFSTGTSFIILSALRMRQVRRAFGLRTIDRLIVRTIAYCTPVTAFLWLTFTILGVGPGTGFSTLALRLLVTGLLLLGTLWKLCLSGEERQQLIGFLLKRRKS